MLKTNSTSSAQSPEVTVFFDGDCPLCRREIDMIQRLDRSHKVGTIDITSDSFDPAQYNKTFDDFMAEIHGQLPNGELITGVEVFRRLYQAVGFGWIVAITRLFGIRHLLDLGYRLFARNRLRLTGRCTQNSCDTKKVARV